VITFTVWGVAQPKGSAKAFVPKGWTRAVVTSDNPKNKGWQQLVAEAAGRARDAAGAALLDGPVRLRVEFHLPRPKSLSKRVLHHTKKPDLDKLVRSVKDGLSRVIWHDDSQVTQITASKTYAAADATPCAVVTVEAAAEPRPLVPDRRPALGCGDAPDQRHQGGSTAAATGSGSTPVREHIRKVEAMSALQDRLDLMIDVVVERTPETVLTEAVDGLHKGEFILWAADGSRVIRMGTKEFAKHGTSLSTPSPRRG